VFVSEKKEATNGLKVPTEEKNIRYM